MFSNNLSGMLVVLSIRFSFLFEYENYFSLVITANSVTTFIILCFTLSLIY